MSIQPPNLWITPASPQVVEQMTRLNKNADRLITDTRNSLNELTSLEFSAADLDPRMQFSQADLDALIAQLGPLPDGELEDWTAGLDLSAGDENFVFSAALLNRLAERFPEFLMPAVPPMPEEPTSPADPGDQPEVPRPVRPTFGVYNAPVVDLDEDPPEYSDMSSEVPFPELKEIVIPEMPLLNIDEIKFEGQRPVFEGQTPDPADFSFAPEIYEPTYLPQLQATVQRMLAGETGLPAEVENALFERAREREIELGERTVDQVTNEWAAKGHRYPSGPHARRVDQARTEASYKVSQLNREQFVQHWQLQLEQMRAALSQAVAAEEVLLRAHADAENLRFQAAQFKLNMTVAVFNAMINKYNADAGLFQVEAAVYRERLQGEMARLEAYSAQLRGLQLQGELNQQKVMVFAERLRALQVSAEVYRTRVQAFTAKWEAINTKVSVFRGQLESNKTLADIYDADTRAFVEMVRAQSVREERFATKATIYGRQVEAWKTRYEGAMVGYNGELERARLTRDAFVADSERLGSWASAESGRVQALSEKYRAIAAEISSKSEAERTKHAMQLELARTALERYRAAYDMLTKHSEITIQSGLTAANLMLRAKETTATTFAQLAAGFTSAANVNASISDQSSSSLGYSFAGQLDVN